MPVFSTRDPLMLAGDPLRPESTFLEAMQATIGQAAESGLLGAMSRSEELLESEGASSAQQFGAAAASREGARPVSQLSPVLAPEDARARLREAGLAESLSIPESGIRSETLDILIDRKRNELRRQSILSSYDGFGAPLLGSLVGTFADPTNIALAFVPVVGQARYAQLLARAGGVAGRTGVRLGVGGAEGFVGLAPVEALNYAANLQQQADYDAYDSLVALAGGAAFGSALHAGAGLLGDLIRPPVRQAPPPAAGGRIAPVAGAEPPAPLLEPPALSREARERAYVMDRLAEGKPVTRAQAAAERQAMMPRTGAEAGAIIDGRLAALQREANDGLLLPDQVKALVKESDELEALVREQDRLARQGVLVAAERRLTPQERDFADARRASIKQQLEAHKRAQGAATALNKLQTKLGKIDADADLIRLADELMPRTDAEQFVESLSPAIRKALDADPFMPVRPFIAQSSPQTQQGALRMGVAQAVQGQEIDVSPMFLVAAGGDGKSLAINQARTAASRVAGANDLAARQAAETDVIEGGIDELKEIAEYERSMLDRMEQSAGVEPDDSAVKALIEIDAQTRAAQSAIDRAATCLLRTGL